MRSHIAETLRQQIELNAIPPFVCVYPPRSAYIEGESPKDVSKIWKHDIQYSGLELNLYIHVPFCHYKCGFCNLYTVTTRNDSDIKIYVDAVLRQLKNSTNIIGDRKLRTIYIGGGTPTILSSGDFRRIFDSITDIYPSWRAVVDEVAIEATPDSLAGPGGVLYLKELNEMGVTRVNLGVQSLANGELRNAGRARADADVIRRAIGAVRQADMPNLSTDLIIGFAGQTDTTWSDSVTELIAFKPETISTYFLTLRPDAWFASTGKYLERDNAALYRRYESARTAFLAAGYVQESNVRYKIPGRGGYQQKVLHFRGVPVLGIGAGARSYTNSVDYVIGGGHRPTLTQIKDYIRDVQDGSTCARLGYVLDDEERIRKRLALDLFDLHLGELANFGWEKHSYLLPILEAAIDTELISAVNANHYRLTSKGLKYRDILSWQFFSDRVRGRDREFYNSVPPKVRRPA